MKTKQRIPVIKQSEYTKILTFIAIKGKAFSFELSNMFNKDAIKEIKEIRKAHKGLMVMPIEYKDRINKLRSRYGMKLQNLIKLKFIINKGIESKGRYGRVSTYSIDYDNLSRYFIKTFLPNDPTLNLMLNNKNKIINKMITRVIDVLNNKLTFGIKINKKNEEKDIEKYVNYQNKTIVELLTDVRNHMAIYYLMND